MVEVREACKYGLQCYRQNPEHLERYSHGGDACREMQQAESSGIDSKTSERTNPELMGNRAVSERGKDGIDEPGYNTLHMFVKGRESSELGANLGVNISEVDYQQERKGSYISVPEKVLTGDSPKPECSGSFKVVGSGDGKFSSTQPRDSIQQLPEPIRGGLSLLQEKPLVVLLGGPPGSGKSTFCERMMKNALRPWTRICQDVIANGKRGSRKQCLKFAKAALSSGNSVLIDRCNMNVEQRADFVTLAANMDAEAHAVFFGLPLRVCIARATERRSHEGGLEGPTAERIVRMTHRSRCFPVLEEGFHRVTICQSDSEVDSIMKLYKQLTPNDKLPGGIHGTLPKVGQTRMKKPNQSGNLSGSPPGVGCGLVGSKNSGGVKKIKIMQEERDCGHDQPGTMGIQSNHPVLFVKGRDRRTCAGKDAEQSEGNKRSGGGDSQHGGVRNDDQQAQPLAATESDDQQTCGFPNTTLVSESQRASGRNATISFLAFPSLSTSTFKFDHEKAASVIVEEASEFLEDKRHEGLGLVLVDLAPNSSMLTKVGNMARKRKLDSLRFQLFAGDITKLRSLGGPPCHVIANATNRTLKEGGGGVNAAIHAAAGPELVQATKQKARTISTGSSLAVSLSPSNPLRASEGITHIIHVLGPNMNPRHPDCLSNDYMEGVDLLHSAYRSLFATFAEVSKEDSNASDERLVTSVIVSEPSQLSLSAGSNLQAGQSNHQTVESRELERNKLPSNAFDVLMHASKRKGAWNQEVGGTSKRVQGGEIGAQGRKTVENRLQHESLAGGSTGVQVECSEEPTVDTNTFGRTISLLTGKTHIHTEVTGMQSSGQGSAGGECAIPGLESSNREAAASADMKQQHGKVRSTQGGEQVEPVNYRSGGGSNDAGFESGMHGRSGRIGEGSGDEDDGGGDRKRTVGGGGWADGLRDIALHPERHKEAVLEWDDRVVIIKDLYPKAKRHVLVISRESGLDRISEAGRGHLPLLRHMETLGSKWAATYQETDPSLRFRLGYHLDPSMRQLHLHVISQDFDSAHLKNKKHWNSFTSPFFLDSKAALAIIEQNGRGPFLKKGEAEALLKQALRCHRCRGVQPNMPRLKTHIKMCSASAQ